MQGSAFLTYNIAELAGTTLPGLASDANNPWLETQDLKLQDSLASEKNAE